MIRIISSSIKQQQLLSQQQCRSNKSTITTFLLRVTGSAPTGDAAIVTTRRLVTAQIAPFSQTERLYQYNANATHINHSAIYHNKNYNNIRTFATSSTNTKPQPKKKETKPNNNVKPAEAGRIVLHQSNLKKLKPGQIKLCNGCGTEVRRASSNKGDNQVSAHQILSGMKANEDLELSKNQAKKARFAEATAADRGAFLCDRCKALQSDNIYKAYDALADVSPEVFSSQLKHIVGRRRYGLCIVVVDSTDAEHSAVKNLRKTIGPKTPIWLVINKIDLLPKMDHRICKQLARRIAAIMDVQSFYNFFAVSAITGKGIYELAERLLQTLGGKDVFIVGCANVGKSTLVHRLAGTIATASFMKGKRGQSRRELCNNLAVTGSHLPGTTLQAVRIPCFQSDRHALWDTPGIINRKAVQYSLFPVHLMEPMARPEKIPLPSQEAGTQGQWHVGYSVLIEAAWMDVEGEEDHEEHAIIAKQIIKDDEEAGINEEKVQQNSVVDRVSSSSDDSEEAKLTVTTEERNDTAAENIEPVSDSDENLESTEADNKNEEGYDDDDYYDVTIRNKRKAALERKKALIAAAKERRRLRMMEQGGADSDDVKDDDYDTSVVAAAPKSESKAKKKKLVSSKPSVDRGPCVLGRIDLTNIENGHAVFAQAYLHPALRLRIVPTSMAPDHATVSTAYLKVVRQRMEEAAGRSGAVATRLKDRYSLPLKAFTEGMLKTGEIIPGDKEYNESYDSYYMDIVFASLGWISISHRGKFTVVPHCVEGSVFSKRPSIYPTNLASQLENHYVDDYIDSSFTGLSEEECLNRLRDAAREGRHAGGNNNSHGNVRGGTGGGSGGQKQYGGMVNDNDLFSYQDSVDESEWY